MSPWKRTAKPHPSTWPKSRTLAQLNGGEVVEQQALWLIAGVDPEWLVCFGSGLSVPYHIPTPLLFVFPQEPNVHTKARVQ